MEIQSLLARFTSILFPPQCEICATRIKEENLPACERCIRSILLFSSFFCPQCGARVPAGEKPCGHARYLLASATSYEQEHVRILVHSLKYEGNERIAELFSYILFEYLKRILPLHAIDFSDYDIIPVPLHKKKERKRGFNQSLLIVKELEKRFQENNMPFPAIRAKALVRTRITQSQTKCGKKKDREKNVAGCFSINPHSTPLRKNVIVCDDVHTTGATMCEVVKTLKAEGITHVIALVIAKT